MKFSFKSISERPVLDAAPNQLRMASCYRDTVGTYHLVVDYISESLGTCHSWQASLRYYTSSDMLNWQDNGIVVECDRESKIENYGVASPHLLWTDSKVLLFYAGRSVKDTSENLNPLAGPNEKGYVCNKIFLAQAPADSKGRIVGGFVKKGMVLDNANNWNSMRIDDPCVLRVSDRLRMYYKGFSRLRKSESGIDCSCVSVGVCECPVEDIHFTGCDEPLFNVTGGGEMPRVFRCGGKWHMFYRHFKPARNEGFWQHYISDDGLKWELNDANLFSCAGKEPGKGATDIMITYGKDGCVDDTFVALACGMEDEILKLWAYEVSYEK